MAIGSAAVATWSAASDGDTQSGHGGGRARRSNVGKRRCHTDESSRITRSRRPAFGRGNRPGRRSKAAEGVHDQNSKNEEFDGEKLRVATASVNTLGTKCTSAKDKQGYGLLIAGKSARLTKEFNERGLDLVGLQETRLKQNSDMQKGEYRILGSAATSAGTFGVQLWIHKRIGVKVIEYHLDSPRRLTAVLQGAQKTWVVSVLHSPIEGDETAAPFMDEAAEKIREIKKKWSVAEIIVLADFNARVGTVQSKLGR